MAEELEGMLRSRLLHLAVLYVASQTPHCLLTLRANANAFG